VLFFGIGVWLGFIVLDGATYLLLVLTLAVGLSLCRRRDEARRWSPRRSYRGDLRLSARSTGRWPALTGIGSIVGGVLNTLHHVANTKRYIFWLLAGTIFAESSPRHSTSSRRTRCDVS
jgi:hypothetical protein